MTNLRAFNDFAGTLADIKEEVRRGGTIAAQDKRNLFQRLSHQHPGDIPGGLAELTELFQVDPDEIQAQFNGFIKETAEWQGRVKITRAKIKSDSFGNRSDLGNATRLVSTFIDDLRFCTDINRWLIWNGSHWAIDETGAIQQYAKATVRGIYKEAGAMTDTAERKAHAAHALRSESESRLKAMVSLARSEPELVMRRWELDAHQFKINATNGIIDLERGELLDHTRGAFFTKILPWAINAEMETPHWDRFLSEITGSDTGLQGYLQQIAGYCLTASTREQCFFIFWGDGRNGKSTFIKILLELMGPWAAQTPADTLMAKKGNNNHNDLARLADKRLVAAIETEEGGRLAEGMIKALAGSDRIAARALYQEFFEYDPTFKVILTTNHKPRIKGTDFAIWRRIRLVPFTWRIPDDKVDPDIFDKLKAEMPGILAWAVKGCMDWQRAGKLETPEVVNSAVREYQKDQDVVKRFIDEGCDVGNIYSDSLKDLFETYEKWSKDNGEYFLSKSRFSRRLAEMGYRREHTKSGARFTGIKVQGDELF